MGMTISQMRAALAAEQASADFADCDTDTLLAQIGRMNVLAISGGRVIVRRSGVSLPVSSGYGVTVDLAGNDTYTVRRILQRAGKTWVKGEVTDVYCEQVGEMAYQASCFRNIPFGHYRP